MEGNKREISSNELLGVSDIKDNFLYTTDGYLICYISIGAINIDLLSEEEKGKYVENLSMSFVDDRKDFVHFSIPSQVNLDPLKEHIKRTYANTNYKPKRKGLNIMLKELMYLSTSGTNFEHQHFIKIWKKIGSNIKDTKRELLVRAEEFKERYNSLNIVCHLLKENDIIRIANLFGNPSQAAYSSISESDFYEMITQLGE